MLWVYFTAKGTGALHKIDGIMRREPYAEILKRYLKTSVRKLKFGHKCSFKLKIFFSFLGHLENRNTVANSN